MVAGNQRQRFRVPAPVFQELAGQLHRIPGHAVNARHVHHLHLGEHVVQAVAEFVEQRGDFVVGQQRRLAVHRRGKVTGQERHRQLQLAAHIAPAHPAVGHPGTAALALAGEQVQIEPGNGLAVTADAVSFGVFVPGFYVCVLFNLHIKQLLRHPKQARHHFIHREPRAQGFRGDVVLLLAQLFAVVADIPGLQVVYTVFIFHKRLQLGKLFLCLGLGLGRQLVQERQHLVDTPGHLGGQGTLGVVIKTQQLGQRMTPLEDLCHYRCVVPGSRIRALV